MWTLQPSSCGAASMPFASFSACSSAWIRDTDVESSMTSQSSAARPRRKTEWLSTGLNVYRSCAESVLDEPIRSSWKHDCMLASMTKGTDCLFGLQPSLTHPILPYSRLWSMLRHNIIVLVTTVKVKTFGCLHKAKSHILKLKSWKYGLQELCATKVCFPVIGWCVLWTWVNV